MTLRKFNVTSDKLQNGIEYGFSEAGSLVMVVIKDELKENATRKVIQEIPATLQNFMEWVSTKNGITVVEIQLKVTFEMFWKKYNEPRSSKKRTMQKWDKMLEAEQIKAYMHIEKYERLRGNAEKKYAETYLNAELWNN